MNFSGAHDSEDSPVIMAHATVYVGFTFPQLLRGARGIFPTRSALVLLRHSAFCHCTANG